MIKQMWVMFYHIIVVRGVVGVRTLILVFLFHTANTQSNRPMRSVCVRHHNTERIFWIFFLKKLSCQLSAHMTTIALTGSIWFIATIISPTLKNAWFGDYHEVIVANNGFIITMSFTAVTPIKPHHCAFKVGATCS